MGNIVGSRVLGPVVCNVAHKWVGCVVIESRFDGWEVYTGVVVVVGVRGMPIGSSIIGVGVV